MRVAILDDYQNAAMALAPWDTLPPTVKVVAFHDTLGEQSSIVQRLRDFEIIVAMRERTAFPKSLLERLQTAKEP